MSSSLLSRILSNNEKQKKQKIPLPIKKHSSILNSKSSLFASSSVNTKKKKRKRRAKNNITTITKASIIEKIKKAKQNTKEHDSMIRQAKERTKVPVTEEVPFVAITTIATGRAESIKKTISDVSKCLEAVTTSTQTHFKECQEFIESLKQTPGGGDTAAQLACDSTHLASMLVIVKGDQARLFKLLRECKTSLATREQEIEQLKQRINFINTLYVSKMKIMSFARDCAINDPEYQSMSSCQEYTAAENVTLVPTVL